MGISHSFWPWPTGLKVVEVRSVREALDAGADVNAVDERGWGALAKAVCWRLLECGYPVLVWGPDANGVAECVRSGAATAAVPSDLAAQATVVIVAAEDGAESERWQLGDHGVVTSLAERGVVVDMTTMSPTQSRRLARAYEEMGGRYLDAPISGGAPAARTGNLVMMIGGPESAFDAVSVVDVLYTVRREAWDEILAGCFRVLRPGGRLILKEVVDRPRWKYWAIMAQETFSVTVFGITKGERPHFESPADYCRAAEQAGFTLLEALPLRSATWISHYLVVAQKPIIVNT